MKKDLIERVEVFGEKVIKLVLEISRNPVTNPLISQLVRSATSIGANYYEAQGACSKKEFINKIYICKKETIETQHWIRMIILASPKQKQDCETQLKEAIELGMIFSTIITNSMKTFDSQIKPKV
jgi:four helix bundle protein